MVIRNYLPGDEVRQAEIYNQAASSLPAFKPASAEEIVRRQRAAGAAPSTRYALDEGGAVVGYALFHSNGRISYPWCLKGSEACQDQLLSAVLGTMRAAGLVDAWLAYRADWQPVLRFFGARGFRHLRDVNNYVAEISKLPHAVVPVESAIGPLEPHDLPALMRLGRGVLSCEPEALERFYFHNQYLDPRFLFIVKCRQTGQVTGIGLAVQNPAYADPRVLDAGMPCFRLGAFGSEAERHKRVNGMFACLFEAEAAGEVVLAEAVRRFERDGLTHAAGQVFSDQKALLAFHDRHFKRQGTFPILGQRLGGS